MQTMHTKEWIEFGVIKFLNAIKIKKFKKIIDEFGV